MATRQQLETQYIQDRAFWGSIGSRWRGLAGGIVMGGMLGIAVGVIGATAFSVIGDIAFAEMGKTTLLGTIGAFGATGMLVGGGLWSQAGQMAGAVAHGLIAQKELDAAKAKGLSQEIELAQLPDTAPKKPLVNMNVTLLGMAISGAVGAALAYTGALPAGVGYTLMGQQAGTAMGALASGTMFAAFGSVFGIAFKPFQQLKQWTDGLFEGTLAGRTLPETGQIKANLLAQAPEPELPKIHIRVSQFKSPDSYRELLAQQPQETDMTVRR